VPKLQITDIELIKEYLTGFVLMIQANPGIVAVEPQIYIEGVLEAIKKLDGFLDENEAQYFGVTINEPTKDHIKRSLDLFHGIENVEDRIKVTSKYLSKTIEKLHNYLTREVNALAWEHSKCQNYNSQTESKE